MSGVLVIDHDDLVRARTVQMLRDAGVDVGEAADSASLRRGARHGDVVLYDASALVDPAWSGVQELAQSPGVVVIVLSDRVSPEQRAAGLLAGAADYIAKPFLPAELLTRLARFIPLPALPAPPLGVGEVSIDQARRAVLVRGQTVVLTPIELDLLLFLARHPDRPFSRRELLRHVWGHSFGDDTTVTVHVRRLRTKIEADAAKPQLITTVWGRGYQLSSGRDASIALHPSMRYDGVLDRRRGERRAARRSAAAPELRAEAG